MDRLEKLIEAMKEGKRNIFNQETGTVRFSFEVVDLIIDYLEKYYQQERGKENVRKS